MLVAGSRMLAYADHLGQLCVAMVKPEESRDRN
jgi:hypothetical protein